MEFTLEQAQALMTAFGGDRTTTLTVAAGGKNAHSGPGLYAYCTDCPEEGAVFLGDSDPEVCHWRWATR